MLISPRARPPPRPHLGLCGRGPAQRGMAGGGSGGHSLRAWFDREHGRGTQNALCVLARSGPFNPPERTGDGRARQRERILPVRRPVPRHGCRVLRRARRRRSDTAWSENVCYEAHTVALARASVRLITLVFRTKLTVTEPSGAAAALRHGCRVEDAYSTAIEAELDRRKRIRVGGGSRCGGRAEPSNVRPGPTGRGFSRTWRPPGRTDPAGNRGEVTDCEGLPYMVARRR